MTRAAIALGSNLGDRLDHLQRAVDRLGELGEVEAVSPLYETEPVGGPDQPAFLNAVVVIRTELAPLDLLARMQEIELDHGRVRAERWGPRTLDLDLIVFDDETVDHPELQVPHPRAVERRFVLAPLADVWPEARVGEGVDAATALERLEGQGATRLLGDWWQPRD